MQNKMNGKNRIISQEASNKKSNLSIFGTQTLVRKPASFIARGAIQILSKFYENKVESL